MGAAAEEAERSKSGSGEIMPRAAKFSVCNKCTTNWQKFVLGAVHLLQLASILGEGAIRVTKVYKGHFVLHSHELRKRMKDRSSCIESLSCPPSDPHFKCHM